MELSPGQTYQEVFDIERKLGRGGMGMVYLARHRFLKRHVALKIPHKDLVRDQDTRRRLEREACLMARLHHEHIVAVYDMRWKEADAFIALEYIEGLALKECLFHLPAETTRLRDALGLALQIARAVDYLHREGVIHRDLKPSNIMVELSSGRAKLLDFGLARTIGADDSEEFRTMFGTVVGTPGYMAPEQAIDNTTATPSADIYSFGVLLYKLLTGHFPWNGEGKQLLAYQISMDPMAIQERNPKIPKAANAALMPCFGAPKTRPASAEEVYHALMETLGPELPRKLYRQVVQADDEGDGPGPLAQKEESAPRRDEVTKEFVPDAEETVREALRRSFERVSRVEGYETVSPPAPAAPAQAPATVAGLPDEAPISPNNEDTGEFLGEGTIQDAIDRLFS